MGRLSPFINYFTLVFIIFVATFLMPNHAAPVQDSAASRYANEKGCYFMNKHYETGHVIETNDPCMNCSCTNAAMMCYLRVCPFIKPLGENCHMEKHVGDCCPKYWCPEVYPRVTSPRPDKEEKGCYLNGLYFEEGARLPVDPLNPCHACYCIRNVSVCTNETCELHIPGCYPRYKIGSCCPASYACTDEAATTIPPTVLEAETLAPGCNVDGVLYEDGVEVPSNESCKKCYCMRHQVMCTAIECTAPGTNCVPHEILEGECCPEKYDCPEDTQISEFATTHMISTEEEFLNLTTIHPPFTSTSTSSSVPTEEDLGSKDIFSTTESEQLFPTTKGIRRIDDDEVVTIVPGLEIEKSTTEATVMTVTGPRVPKITEIPEDMFTTRPRSTTARPFFPKRPIPGEGICRHENRTYQNREKVESSDPCRENCTCVNSVVKCDVVECVLEPPTPGQKCKVKILVDECCPKYVCDMPSSTTLQKETETIDQDVTENMFVKDFFENATIPDIATMQAETIDQDVIEDMFTKDFVENATMPDIATMQAETVVSEKTTPSTEVFSETSSEDEAISKSKETTVAIPTEIPFVEPTPEQETTDKLIDDKVTTKSTVIKDDTEIVPTVSTDEKETAETQFIPESFSTTSITKITSEKEHDITQLSTEEKDITQLFTTHPRTKVKDEGERITEESKKTTIETKTTVTLKSVTSETPKEGIVKFTIAPEKEDISTVDKEIQTETISPSHTPVEFTTKREPITFESETTEKSEMRSTVSLADEKEMEVTEKEFATTSTLDIENISTSISTEEKDQSMATDGEFLTVLETKSTEESSSAHVSTEKLKETITETTIPIIVKDMDTEVIPEKETKLTTVEVLEAQTVTMTPSVTEKRKSTITTEKSKTELEMKVTDEMKKITTAFPDKEKDVQTEATPEKESILTTVETLEAQTTRVTPSVTEKEKSTTITEKSRTELEMKITDEIKEITTAFPTKEKDVRTEATPEKEGILTTVETLEAQTTRVTPSATEKEKSTTIIEEDKTELEMKIADEMKKITTAFPTKEKDVETEVTTEKESISTTVETLEAQTSTVTPSVTEKEKTPITEESKTEFEVKITDEMKEITTAFPTKEKDIETESTPEKDSKLTTVETLEAQTVTMTPSVTEKEKLTTTTEEDKTELLEKTTGKMKDITTAFPTKVKDVDTEASSEKEGILSTVETLEAQTATVTPSVTEKEKLIPITEDSKTELEMKTTDEMKEITTAFPTKEKDIETESTPEKDSKLTTVGTLEAQTVTMTPSVTEKVKFTPITDEGKTELEMKITDEMKEITTAFPTKVKDVDTEASPEKEGILSTVETLEAQTATVTPSVTEKEKLTPITEDSKTELEIKTTDEMKEITTAFPSKEKDIETEYTPEKESISTTVETLRAQTSIVTPSVTEKEKTPITEESTTEFEGKITDEMKEITTAFPTKEKDVETEVTTEKESISTTVETLEAHTSTVTPSVTEKEKTPITEESKTEFEVKITDEMKEITTAFPTKEKDIETETTPVKESISITVETLEAQTSTVTSSVTEKEKAPITEESKTEFEVKITDEMKETTTAFSTKEKDMETEATPVKESKLTTADTLEAETTTMTASVPEKEKLTPLTEESKIELEMKTTDEMKEITTAFPIKEKDIETEYTPEKESVSTTVETLEAQKDTLTTSVTEKEKTPITEVEMKITDEMKEITTAFPTKEKDIETEATPVKESISTTVETLEVEIGTVTPNVTEKEKTPITEESKTEFEVKITDEMKEITIAFPTKEKDIETESTPEKESISTTVETLEAQTGTVTPTVTEKEKTSITEESKTEFEVKITDKMKEITTAFPTKEKDVETEVTSEKESKLTTAETLEARTVTMTPSVTEKEKLTTTTEEDKTELLEKTTGKMKDITTAFPTKVKDIDTEASPEKEGILSTVETLEAQTATVTPSVTEKEKLTPITEDSKTELEMKETDKMKEITIAFPTKEKDIETESTPEKESISTTVETLEAQTGTVTPSVTEKEKTPITEESKTEFEVTITEEMKEITTAFPIREKDAETEVTAEKESIITTAETLEAETTTMTASVTQKEKLTPTTEEDKTELLAKTTDKMKEITITFPTEEKDVEIELTSQKESKLTTVATLEAQTVTMTQSVTEKEKTPTTEESKTELEMKTTEEMKEITTAFPIREKDAETEVTAEKESIITTAETLEAETTTMTASVTQKEKLTPTTEEDKTELLAKTTDKMKEITTTFPTKEKDLETEVITEKESKLTTEETLEAQTATMTPSVTEKEKSTPITEETKTELEMKTTDEMKEITTAFPTKEKDIETEVTAEKEIKLTTEETLEAQTVTMTPSVTEKEKSTPITEETKTELEIKTTDEMKEITTAFPIKEKDIETEVTAEKESKLTTEETLEAQTVTMTPSVIEKEKSTPITEETKTELEIKTTDEMKEITTAFPTKEKDVETEVTPEKESKLTTEETLEAKTVTVTPSVTEKEKLTPITEESKTESEMKITEEMKEISTAFSTTEKDGKTEVTAEKESKLTTEETLEAQTVTMTPRVTEKEKSTPITEETKTELEIKTTHEMKEITTAFPTEEKDIKTEVTAEKESKLTTEETLEAQTVTMTPSVTEKEKSTPITEETKTELEIKTTDEMKEITTAFPIKEKDIETEVTAEKESKLTTEETLEAQTVTMTPSVAEKEKSTPITEETKTELEIKTTDEMKEITTAFPTKEKDVETEVTPEKESKLTKEETLAAQTVTMTPSVTEKEKLTPTIEESKIELEMKITDEMKEITAAFPMKEKDLETEFTPEKESILTTIETLEDQITTMTPRVTEKEKLTPTTEESKTELQTKITDERKGISTALPTKEKDVETEVSEEKESISTTVTMLESKIVTTAPSAIEKDKLTPPTEERKTELESEKTDVMKELTTIWTPKQKDFETEVTPAKEIIATTAAILDAEDVTITPSITVPEKSTFITEETKGGLDMEITDDMLEATKKDIMTTLLPLSETEISKITGKENRTISETKATEEIKSITTELPKLTTDKKYFDTKITLIQDDKTSTTDILEAETVSTFITTKSKEESSVMDEKDESMPPTKTSAEEKVSTKVFPLEKAETEMSKELEDFTPTLDIKTTLSSSMSTKEKDVTETTDASESQTTISSSLPTDDKGLKTKDFSEIEKISTTAMSFGTPTVISEKEKLPATELGADTTPLVTAKKSLHTDVSEFTESMSDEVTTQPDTELVSFPAASETADSFSVGSTIKLEAEPETTSQLFDDSDKISSHPVTEVTEKSSPASLEEITLKGFSSIPTMTFETFSENITSVPTFTEITEVKSETKVKEIETQTENVTRLSISTLKPPKEITETPKDIESPLTMKTAVSETVLDEIAFKRTDLPITTEHLQRIPTMPSTIAEKMDTVEFLTSPILPELITQRTDMTLNETTSTMLKFTTVPSIRPDEKIETTTMQVPKDFDKDLTSEETDHTIHETDIVTDNVFTSIKHVPDSLIRERTTIFAVRTEEITLSPFKITEITRNVTESQQFSDQDFDVITTTILPFSEKSTDKITQAPALEAETSAVTLIDGEFKTTTLLDKKATAFTTLSSKVETQTSPAATELDKGTDRVKLSSPPLPGISTTVPSDISSTVQVDFEAETSSELMPKEVSIFEEDKEILARKPTISETKDIDKLTTESTKVTQSEITLDSNITTTGSSVSTRKEKIPELTDVYEVETSTFQATDKTLSTSDLFTKENYTTILPTKETDVALVTTVISKEESETTLKIELSAETAIPETNDTIKDSTLLPHRTEITSSDEIQTSTIITKTPTKEEEITTRILSEFSTVTSSVAVEDKTTLSTKLPERDVKKDVTISEIDITSVPSKTSFKTDFETSTQLATTGISKDVTKLPLTTGQLSAETITFSSLDDEKSAFPDIDRATTLSEHDMETPSVSTKIPFSSAKQTEGISESISVSTMLPKEITEKLPSIEMKPSTQVPELETETQQAEEFESTKTLFTDTSKFTEISHMDDTTYISEKQTSTTQEMTELQTTVSESKLTELAKDLETHISTEVTQITKKDSDSTKLQTPTALDFMTETVRETTSDKLKETTTAFEVETKQTSEEDLSISTSKIHSTDMITDKLDTSTHSSVEILDTTKTVIPIETFKAEETETSSKQPLTTPEKIKTTIEVTDFTLEDKKVKPITEKISIETETSTKYLDSETKIQTDLKTEVTTLIGSSEETSTLTPHPLITVSPEKEQTIESKLPTISAETTFTEHSVITEETIPSNATFAADAMIKPQTTTIETSTSSLKTDISITQEDVSSVDLKLKTATDVITIESEGEEIIKVTTETATKAKTDKESTSEGEFESSTISTIAVQESTKPDFTTTQMIHSSLLETTQTSTFPPIKPVTAVTEKVDIISTTAKFKDDTLSPDDKTSPTEESLKEITEIKTETSIAIEKVTKDIITPDVSKLSFTTEKELEEKIDGTFVTEFVGKTSEPLETLEAETGTQQAEIMTTVFVKKDNATLLEETSIPQEFATEKAIFSSKETETPTTKLDTSTLLEKTTDVSAIQTVLTVNETTTEPSKISNIYPETKFREEFTSRSDEKFDHVTSEKEIESPTIVPDMTPTTPEEIKTSLKQEADKEMFDGVSTTLIASKIPAITEETSIITDTETSETHSLITGDISTISPFTKTQKPVDSFTEITHKTEIPQTAETTKSSEIISDKVTLKDETIFTESVKLTDIAKESLKPETTFTEEFVTKAIASETSEIFTEKEDISSEAHRTASEFEFSTTSATTSTTERAPIIFDTAETKEADFKFSATSAILDSETSISHVTEKSPEVSESTSSTATTMLPKMVTEETTTLRPIMITDLESKDFTSESIKETTPIFTKEDITPKISEDDRPADTTEDECIVNGTTYRDGEAVTTIDPCEKCHCSLGEINCFKILCKLPKENCIPKFSSTFDCCPSSYECPEKDKEKASTLVSFAATETDLTTPIPISFMFSTTPKAIASTVFVTKSEEEKERKMDSTMTLPADHLTTIDTIATSTESDVSAKTATTKQAISDGIDLSGRKSIAQDETPEDLLKHVDVSDQDFETSDATEISAKETELISTTEKPKRASEIDELTTLSMEGEESSEATPEKSATFVTTTVRKETDIAEVTKQPTETPTTFDTIRTTFADVHKEKEDETLFESTTITHLKTDEKMTKIPDFAAVSTTVEASKETLKTETPSVTTADLGTVTVDKTSKEIITEKIEKETTREETTSFDETTTSKIFEITEKEETMFGETVTGESREESVTEPTKTSKVTSFTVDLETSTSTYMPSKLPKLDDMLTSTEMTISETERRKEATKDVEKTTKTETIPTEISMITEKVTEDILKYSIASTKQDDVSVDVKPSTKPVITEKEAEITLSGKEEISSESVSITTEEIKLDTTLGKLSTVKLDFDTIKDHTVQPTTASLITSKYEDEISSVTFKTVTEEETPIELKTDEKIDRITTTFAPEKDISTVRHEKTTDYEITTEVFEARKTIDALDQKRTVSTPEKETEFSSISTDFTTRIDEISARRPKPPHEHQQGLHGSEAEDKHVSIIEEMTTASHRKVTDQEIKTEKPETNETATSLDKKVTLFTHMEETEFPTVSTVSISTSNVTTEETETTPTVTDRIFTFVSTRFTDLMKGITEFTTKEVETMDASKTDTTSVTPFDTSIKETEKVTSLTLLTRKIDLDLDQTTVKEEITQKTETVELASKELFTTSEDKTTTPKFDTETPLTLLTRKIDLDLDQTTMKDEITHDAETVELTSKEPLTTLEDKITTPKFYMETIKDTEIATGKLTVTPQIVSLVPSMVTAETTKGADSELTEMPKEKTQTLISDVNVTSTEIVSTVSEEKSSVFPEVTTSSHKETTAFFTEKKPVDFTGMTTILPKTTPEEVTTKTSLIQDRTSPVQITEEIRSESTKTQEITSFKTEEQTISSLSTEELAAETLKTDKETKLISITADMQTTTIAFTTEREKVALFDETEVPSRATRKDVEFEVTPSSFTKTETDSEILPANISTTEVKTTVHELNVSSEITLPVTPAFDQSTVSKETTIKHLESSPTIHDIVTEKLDSETISIFNETVSTISEVTGKTITTTSAPKIVNETKITAEEVSPIQTKTEGITSGIDITTQSLIIKTTHRETIPSVVEDTETMKTQTELPKVTESVQTMITDTTSEKRLITEEVMTTQKEQQNLTQTMSADTTVPQKVETTVTPTPVKTAETTTKPELTTAIEDSESTVISFRKPPQAEVTERPEVSTPSTKEELNATEFVTKGYKSIETTTMKEEEDYIIDENTCIFEGRIFQSAEQIPRADPCEFCFCFRGDIICLQQSCPPPAPNCHQTTIPGYCCPRYECPVYVTSKNISALSRRKGVTPIIIQRRIDKREVSRPTMEIKGCQYNGTFYEMGKTVTSASGPCLHCVCQEDGFMHCDPQRCKPEAPLMLKMNSNFFRRR